MTRIKTSKGEFLMVPIPADAIDIQICSHGLFYKHEGEQVTEIPSGTYEFMFTTGTVSEEQAALVVEQIIHMAQVGEGKLYMDYEMPSYHKLSAKQSFASLLRSHNLNADNYACIKLLK